MILENFINSLILVAIFFWYNKKVFHQTSPNKYDYLFLGIFVILKWASDLFNSLPISAIVTLITYLSISWLFFEGPLKKKLVFIIFFLIAYVLANLTSYVFLNALYNQYNFQNSLLLYTVMDGIFSKSVLFIMIYFITKVSDIKSVMSGNGLGYVMSFPTISVFIIYTLMQSNDFDLSPTLSIICILISLGIVLFNIILCIMISNIMRSKNNQIEQEKLKNQELHYLLLEEKIESSKKFIHDFKKHVNIINGFVHNHEIEKLNSYLNELSTEIKNDENFVVTGNQLIDLSLNANKNALLSNAIDIKYDIKIKELTPVSDFDFNIVFSNILDNAIESCIRTNGHFIKIKLDKTNDLIVLKVINPCFEVQENFETSKSKDDHGYGIKNIKSIVQKYDGNATFKFDKENRVFISTVIFNNV